MTMQRPLPDLVPGSRMTPHLRSARRQRGINPFMEMLTLALIVASVWLTIVVGKHYLGAAWWQTVLYGLAGLVLGVAGMGLGHYSPMLGMLALAGMVVALILF